MTWIGYWWWNGLLYHEFSQTLNSLTLSPKLMGVGLDIFFIGGVVCGAKEVRPLAVHKGVFLLPGGREHKEGFGRSK